MDFSEAIRTLKGRETRKIANNTYLQTRETEEGRAIAVKLHATDVVTYHPDGTVTLRTGGFESVTTKARMNDYGPDGIRVYSQNRQWRICTRPYWSHSSGSAEMVNPPAADVPYVDGMRFDPSDLLGSTASLRTLADERQRLCEATERQIATFLRHLTPKRLSELVATAREPMGMTGDCLICRIDQSAMRDHGRAAVAGTDAEHLTSHLDEDYWHASLIIAALIWTGYRFEQIPYNIDHLPTVKRATRRYLRFRLISSADIREIDIREMENVK